ncbi:hypothetical protein K4F52_007451 [Lecanicillium sp. MT-2017a]|nr:hypothetical protein K4F52_007451 [Lecanicillium sp. MT-2017a]
MKPTPFLLTSLSLTLQITPSTANKLPYLTYNIDTILDCSYWYDNQDGHRTCESIRTAWQVSPEDFARWNPDLTVDCTGWETGHSYCVAVEAERGQQQHTSPSHITTAPTATRSSSGGVVTPVWSYLGCYTDDSSIHPLQTQLSSPAGEDLNPSKCEAACWAAEYPFVGLKGGDECWCGTYVDGGTSSSPRECNVPCAGDEAETCGGDGVFNVFQGVVDFSHLRSVTTASTMLDVESSSSGGGASTPTAMTSSTATSSASPSSSSSSASSVQTGGLPVWMSLILAAAQVVR